MGRRAGDLAAVEPRALVVCQRGRPVLGAVGEFCDGRGIHAAFTPQHAEQHRARRICAHQISAGGLAAQRVVYEAGDGGTVARTGKAVRQPPALEGVGRRTALRFDDAERFDRGGKPRGGGHLRADRPECGP